MNVCVHQPPKQMVRDVCLRQAIDFRKQISSLVKQNAPLGAGEGGRKGGLYEETERAFLTSASTDCREMEGDGKRGKNKRMRAGKTAPIELYCCSWKKGRRGEEKRKEGERREDNGVNAGRQAAAVVGLIHKLTLSGDGTKWGKPAFDLWVTH